MVLSPGYGRVAAVVTCLLLWPGCCHHKHERHGFVVRGGWSLECNRIPWMASHGTQYQAPATFTVCPSANMTVADPRPPCAGCGHSACQSRGGIVVTGSRGQCEAAGSATASDYVHPRFHAVPTRPAFAPPESCPQEQPDGHLRNLPAEEELPWPESPPVAPTPEPVPTPTGSQDGWKPLSEPTESVSQSTSWIFAQPATVDPLEMRGHNHVRAHRLTRMD
jgi:hypothetical protein